jgi:hypothetical protein
MMWFTGTRPRRPRRLCEGCGGAVPLDAIRLRGGRLYCPQGVCRGVAERLIREARGRSEAAQVAQQMLALAEMPGVTLHFEAEGFRAGAAG